MDACSGCDVGSFFLLGVMFGIPTGCAIWSLWIGPYINRKPK